MKKIVSIAAVAALGVVGAASADTVDIDMTGFQVWGDFLDPQNSDAIVNIGAGSTVTGIEFIDFSFESLGFSWQSEFILSVETGDAMSYWDWQLAPGTDGPGVFGPVTGAYDGAIGAPAGGGSFVTNDGIIRIYAWETWDDDGLDSVVLSGTLRVTYTAIPAPGALALLGVAGLVGTRRRRA